MPRPGNPLPPVVLAVLAVLAAVAGPLATTGAAQASGDLLLPERVEQRGDIVEIRVETDSTEPLRLHLESRSGEVQRTLPLRDDGDGVVVINWNTFSEANSTIESGHIVPTSGDIEWATGGLQGPPADEYLVKLGRDGDQLDSGTVRIQPRGTGDVTVLSGPRPLGNTLQNLTAIRSATSTETLVTDHTVTLNATLVFEIEASGFEGRLAVADGENSTTRFVSLFERKENRLVLHQTNPTPERLPKVIPLGNTSGTTVIPDTANDTYYLVTALSELEPTWDSSSPVSTDPSLYPDESFSLNLTIDGETRLFDLGVEQADPSPILTVTEPEIGFGESGVWEFVQLPSDENATLKAVTGLQQGTTVTVRIHSRSDDGPVIQEQASVGDYDFDHAVEGFHDDFGANDIRLQLDTSELETGTSFDISIEAYGETLTTAEGRILPESNASVSLPETETWRDGEILVQNVTLSEGDFLVVQSGYRLWPAAPDWIMYRGHAEVEGQAIKRVITIEAGEDLFRLAAPHPRWVTVIAVEDTNENGRYDRADLPLYRNGSMIAAVADIPDPKPANFPTTTEPTATTTTTTVITSTTNTLARTTSTETPMRTATTVPGFGFGLALVPLLGAILVLVFRRN